ncbi:MAG: LuxR C-terminal-related transcriptional regulator [Nitrospira sp.]|nr:LuxR C-terminal-related transcriptional regulator [Nitrospira sp.]
MRSRGNTALQSPRAKRSYRTSGRLTPRQSQILTMVAMGHTNREIAAALGISIRTVEVHRYHLMHRLEVRNVAQLLRRSLKLGLLPRRFGK